MTAAPPGSMPWKISALASAMASTEGKNSRCTGSTVVMIATCGRTSLRQRRDLAGVVHAHFEHRKARARRAARQRQRHAPVVVVGSSRSMRLAVARQRELERLLGAGLADRAGDADELGRAALPRGARQRDQALQHVGHHQQRRVVREHAALCSRRRPQDRRRLSTPPRRNHGRRGCRP